MISISDALAFDTHRFVKRMTAVGMPEQQAEALAESQVDLLNANLVTKTELANTEAALRGDIAETNVKIANIEAALRCDIAETNVKIANTEAALRGDIAETNVKIASTEARLIKWMVGLTMGSVGVMVALFSFFLS